VREGTGIGVGFVIAKDFCTYTTIILRHDKRLRDHALAAGSGGRYVV
jgi:hypothetical protein